MKTIKPFILIISLSFGSFAGAQQNEIVPDLSKIRDTNLWTLQNRELVQGSAIHLNGKPGDGMLWLNASNFSNCTIDLDMKGKDENGKSFVGLAFHGLNDSTYDVIYFRPFNFKSKERNGHSVQYISHPNHTWFKLRKEHPEVYENKVAPVPDPNDWFHATIKIEYPEINVFVNHSEKSSLSIKQLNTRKEGRIGFWVGYNSEGYFKNLKITTK